MPQNIEKPKLSYRKLAANRANAQKSTGPRTLKGKAISSQNGSKAPVFHLPVPPETNCDTPEYAAKDFIDFSILPGESRDEFVIIHQQFLDDYKPQSPTEIMIIEQMSRNQWNVLRLQATLLYTLTCQIRATTQGTPSERPVKVTSNAAGTRSFEALERALARAQRLRSRLMKDLEINRQLRKEHASVTTPPQDLPICPSEAKVTQKNVRPNPPNESLILNFPRVPYTIALAPTPEQPPVKAVSVSYASEETSPEAAA